ncbi:YphA family membrane protein [Alkalihalobacillus alcalophilus]
MYFYWAAWGVWIVLTFFFNKTNQRFWLTVCLLTIVTIMPLQIFWNGFSFRVALIPAFMFICSFLRFYKWPKMIYMLVLSSLLAIAYATFDVFTLFDPVVLFIDQRIYLAAISFIIASFHLGSIKDKAITSIVGMLQGEFLSGFVKHYFFGFAEIGRMLFLDVVTFTICIFACIAFIRYMLSSINQLFLQWRTGKQQQEVLYPSVRATTRARQKLERANNVKVDA